MGRNDSPSGPGACLASFTGWLGQALAVVCGQVTWFEPRTHLDGWAWLGWPDGLA